MWKKANVQDPVFWYAPGWNQIADPAWSLDGATYTVTLPEATSDQWQAQMLITTDMSTTSANNYDFSVVLNSSLAHPHVTIKLTDATDDGIYYFAEQVALNAYEDYVFYMSDMPGLDIASLKLVFDFGGNEAGSVITMSNIVLKNHADDDGTVLPADNGGEEGGDDSTTWVDVNSADNLWNGVSYTNFFYYAPGWSPIGDPGFVDNNGTYTISLPSATFDQWQAQVHFLTNIATTADKTYDLRIVLNSTQDVAKATIKLCDVEDDGIFYFTDRVNLTAYDDCVFTETGLTGQEIANLKLVFDFGGNPDNTEITISGIILQEHVGE
jgi:preprotein translocase subunit SecB